MALLDKSSDNVSYQPKFVLGQITDLLLPSCAPYCATLFHCANPVFQPRSAASWLYTGRRRRREIANISNPARQPNHLSSKQPDGRQRIGNVDVWRTLSFCSSISEHELFSSDEDRQDKYKQKYKIRKFNCQHMHTTSDSKSRLIRLRDLAVAAS